MPSLPHLRAHHLATDTLVLGGGIAGCFASSELRRRGHDVIVLDKAPLRRSGNAGGGIDHWIAGPAVVPECDRPGVFLDVGVAAVRGMLSGNEEVVDIANVGAGMSRECLDLLLEIEALGIEVRDAHGHFRMVEGAGFAAVWIEGGDFKPKVAKAALDSGARRLEHVMATDLLTTDDGSVCGAVGFHTRTGAFYTISARAVLVATGWTARLHHPGFGESDADRAFDGIYCPFDTGDGQMAAFRAGAELTHMEMITLSVSPRDYGTAGISGFLSAGCRLQNGLGEHFMDRYEPGRRETAARQRMARACLTEIEAGRGPIYIDTRGLSAADVADIRTAWANEVPLVPRYLALKGIEPGRDRVEVVPSIALATGAVKCDPGCRASVPGLWAAGDCADVSGGGAAGAAIAGRRAARGIDAYLRQLDGHRAETGLAPSAGLVERLRADLFRPLRSSRSGDLAWQDFAAELRHIMGAYLGVTRNAAGIEVGRARLDSLLELEHRLRAEDAHELMRVQETRNLVRFGRVMAAASAERRESRYGQAQWHRRADHPETDDEEFSFVVVSRGASPDGAPLVSRRAPQVSLEVARSFAESLPRRPQPASAAR